MSLQVQNMTRNAGKDALVHLLNELTFHEVEQVKEALKIYGISSIYDVFDLAIKELDELVYKDKNGDTKHILRSDRNLIRNLKLFQASL